MTRDDATSSSQVLRQLLHVLRSETRRSAHEHDLSASQLEALRYLEICNRYSDTPLGVAEYLGATKGTVSQSLRSLLDKGLIEKIPDAEDGRVVHCKLTAAGRRVVKQTSWPLGDDLPIDGLVELLRTAQRERGHRTFGACRTCRHFEPLAQGGRCGLTTERLKATETVQICREHNVADELG